METLNTLKDDVVALIPARSGSIRIKNKNIKCINGVPLIGIAVIQALLLKNVGKVYVSTDSEKYAEVARNFGADIPFLRPIEIAGENTTDLEVFQHFVNWLQETRRNVPEIIVQIRATSPLRNINEVEKCVEFIKNNKKFDSLRTISIPHQSPYKMWSFMNESLRVVSLMRCENDEYDKSTQSLPKVYAQDGVVDVIRTSTIQELNSMSGKTIAGWITQEQSWDIDTPRDFLKVSGLINTNNLLLLSSNPKTLGKNLGIIQGRLTSSQELQCFPNFTWRQEFDLARKAGYTCIELIRDQNYNPYNPLWNKKEIEDLLDCENCSGVGIRSVCDDYVQNCNWEQLTIVEYNTLIDLLLSCSKLGVRLVVYPLMGNAGITDMKTKKAFIVTLKGIAALAKSLGITILVEANLNKKELLNILKEIDMDNVRCCLDIGNLYANKCNYHEYIEDQEMLSYIGHVHIKDRNLAGENVVLGTGEINYMEVLRALIKSSYCGSLICETNRGSDPLLTAVNNISYLKECIGNI